jgi:hypothetical protein
MLTVHTAKPKDIWPDGSGYSRQIEDEIIRVARNEITNEDVTRSGLSFAPWFIPFYLAEERVRERAKNRETIRKHRARQPKPATSPQPIPKGGTHPSAARWSKWPKLGNLDGLPVDYQEHLKEWSSSVRRSTLAVYRPNLDDSALATVSDCRKIFRDLQLRDDALQGTLIYVLKTHTKEIKELEDKVAELETRKIPQYRGVWQEDQHYNEADLVTYGGSMWYCKRTVTGRPSTNHDAWQLCVKSGRDGRDGKPTK